MFIGLVLGGGLVALAVSTVVAFAIGVGIYDDGRPCHDCEACQP